MSNQVWVKCGVCDGKGLVEFHLKPVFYIECKACFGRGGVYEDIIPSEPTPAIWESFGSDNTTLPFEPTEAEQAAEEEMDEETMQLEAETAACEEIEAGGEVLLDFGLVPDFEVKIDPLACPNEGCEFVAKTEAGLKVHAGYCKFKGG